MNFETRRISRRGLFKAGTALAVAAVTPVTPRPTAQRAQNVEDAGTLERVWRQAIAPNQSILLKGGTVVSMDPRVGDFVKGDVLIQGKKIASVGADLKAPAQTQVIDATNTIVIPGFVDAHRHSWEGQLRRIIPNGAINEYMATTHQGFARYYRPHDMYVGNLITALGCIDSGITCIIDNSHNARSAAHSDAAVDALFDSGIRAVHASGAPQAGEWAHQWPGDLERLQKKYFSSNDQLVTLRLFSAPNRENWELGRRLGLRITTEFQGPMAAMALDALWAEKMVRPDNTLNHCGALPDRTWQIIKDSGANVNVCPRSDAQYALGEGIAAYQHALDHGIRPGFSIDNETSYSTDIFSEMRMALYLQRAVAQNRRFAGDGKAPAPVMVRDVLECATVNGAVCAGLADKIGSISPGKEADVVMIRAGDINLYPSNNAVGTVVQAADRSNIDTVIIGGRLRKFRGRLEGLDLGHVKRMIDESRRYLFAKAGYKEDLFAEKLPKLY